MRNSLLTAMLFCCAVAMSASGAYTQEQELRERFLREAPIGWQTYEDHFLHLQGTYEAESYYGPPDALALERRELREYKVRDGCKVDISRAVIIATGEIGYEAIVHNTRYGFRLKKKGDDAEWRFIEGIQLSDLDPATEMYDFVQEPPPIMALTRLGVRPLRQLLSNPQFQVTLVTEEDHKGVPAVKVSFTMDESKGPSEVLYGGVLVSGVIWCDPGRNWILLHSKYDELRGTTIAHAEESFEIPPGEPFPLPTRLAHRQGAPEIQKELAENRLLLNFKVPSTLPPESDFTLTAFGLPELEWLAEQEAPSASSTWIWITVIGIVVLLGGFAFFVFSRRRMKA